MNLAERTVRESPGDEDRAGDAAPDGAAAVWCVFPLGGDWLSQDITAGADELGKRGGRVLPPALRATRLTEGGLNWFRREEAESGVFEALDLQAPCVAWIGWNVGFHRDDAR